MWLLLLLLLEPKIMTCQSVSFFPSGGRETGVYVGDYLPLSMQMEMYVTMQSHLHLCLALTSLGCFGAVSFRGAAAHLRPSNFTPLCLLTGQIDV